MKKTLTFATILIMLVAIMPNAKAQEWSTGLDIYSSYLWRGYKFGTGAAFQPGIEFSTGGLAIGAWGSYSTGSDEAAEADLYASYSIALGESASLDLIFTDYFFPAEGANWFDANHHIFEPAVGIGVGSFSFMAAYALYQTEMEGKKETSQDLYLEAALSAGPVDLTLGGGNGMYSSDGEKFEICNIGVGTSKEISITESFSIPVSGATIWNPASKSFHVVVGISL